MWNASVIESNRYLMGVLLHTSLIVAPSRSPKAPSGCSGTRLRVAAGSSVGVARRRRENGLTKSAARQRRLRIATGPRLSEFAGGRLG